MVWPGGHGMIYGMAWYMLWPGEHHMVYGMAWRTSHGIWYGLVRHSTTCFKALPAHIWSGRCQLKVLFTRTVPVH